ncbi:MAG: winged helix-turn-helix domain-containing protein, partial [Dehalococcoidia bacterium]
FVARVRAQLRRAGGLPERAQRQISIGDVTVEEELHRVLVRNRQVHLTPLEFSLLYTLMRDPGVVYSREDLLDSVWGSRDVAVERTIDAHIWKLRRKIEAQGGAPRHILCVPRLGYRFRRPDRDLAQPALAV